MIKIGTQWLRRATRNHAVTPDTGIDGVDVSWDFGNGFGFYLDATQALWSQNIGMYSDILHKLRQTVIQKFPARAGNLGIFGHLMRGHGGLLLALRNPDVFRSVSILALTAEPGQCSWGQKEFGNYLGAEQAG